MADPRFPIRSYLPWVRRGVTALFANKDTLGLGVPGRLAAPAELWVNDPGRSRADRKVSVPVWIFGPGEVVGLDPRQVVRVQPPHQTTDFEPNLFACVELDDPGLPWMFTPAAANDAGQLRPWICLVAVRKREGVRLFSEPGRPLPVLECPPTELPDLKDSWAWAHAQVTRAGGVGPDSDIKAILNGREERTVSRLICPRRLDPNESYLACVVPTFEAGRKAGLGEPLGVDDVRELRPAWAPAGPEAAGVTRVPVLFHFEFRTGIGGDFEALVRRLRPRHQLPEVRPRRLDLNHPGWTADPPAGMTWGSVDLEGALRVPGVPATPWPEAQRGPFQRRLREILNPGGLPGSTTDVEVTPPIYGQTYARQDAVPADDAGPHWLRELNLDPRYRVAAGLGAEAIRLEQESLTAAAWDQIATDRADARVALSEQVRGALLMKHFVPLAPEALLRVAAPLRESPSPTAAGAAAGMAADAGAHETRAGLAAAPRDPEASTAQRDPTLTAAFRRLARPGGPIARHLDGGAAPAPLAAHGLPSHALAGLFESPFASRSGLTIGRAMGPVEATETAAVGLSAAKARILGELDPAREAPVATFAAAPAADLPPTGRFTPTFDKPMYEALRDYFPDMLLPGLERVPPNTVTLLETNARFIEAFMVGLNHEMGRELRWRDFPVNVRGTYFTRFWQRLGGVESGLGPQDIPPIAGWSEASELGSHSPGGGRDMLVVLIRGDLLRRHPRTLIYASQATWADPQRTVRTLGQEERYPAFRGTWGQDVTFLGYDLTQDQARGGGADPGWFFVLEEPRTEPRFGLDAAESFGTGPEPRPATWEDLTWGHLVPDEAALKALVYVPVTGPLAQMELSVNKAPESGKARWGRNGAHMAAICEQTPFRMAVHADAWLPPRA